MKSKKKSPIWKYFKDDMSCSKSVVCILCGMKIFCGDVGGKTTSSGMLNHMKYKHSEEFHKLVPKLPKGQNTRNENKRKHLTP